MTWTAQAEDLTSGLGELGMGAAVLNAAAWSARIDPDATSGLTGAALALGAPPSALYSRGIALASDTQMAEAVADLEAGTGEALKHASGLRQQVAAALESAYAQAEAALGAQSRARTPEEAGAAAGALVEAQRKIADCECALELLDGTTGRLKYALACLQRVPDELLTTYEAAYTHVHCGGKLPHHGDFLTGVPA